jgi:ubiquinone/menaquinone biosynthesis C-methylase UbiE
VAGGRVLDVGCGAGATSIAVARAVGDTGNVVGVDISRALLRRAEERKRDAALTQIEFLPADAQTHQFEPGGFDLIVSRFGTMFFADPVAAFGNVAVALRPGGRIVFISWADLASNPWFTVSRDAAVAVLGEPPPVPKDAPGPLAFADRNYVLDILRQAGFSDASATEEHASLVHSGGVAAAARLASSLGPASRIIKEFGGSGEQIAEIGRRIERSLTQYAESGDVRVPARVNVFAAVKA